AQRPTTVHRSKFLPPVNWDRSMRGYKPKLISVSTPNRSVACIAQPCSVLCNHVEHRLNVGRRAGDNAQDFARGRLLLQGLLQFLEQPNVLDGNHRLIGEGFKQLDLRRGEGTYLETACSQNSNEFSLLTKRNGQKASPASSESGPWDIVLFEAIWNVNRTML